MNTTVLAWILGPKENQVRLNLVRNLDKERTIRRTPVLPSLGTGVKC